MGSKLPAAGSKLRQLGWVAALGLALALFLSLTFHVNAIKSDVRLAERQIIALQRETLMLETEFQTRSSQRQLSQWNTVEFGYVAPKAHQYLENEQQLAMLGLPRGLGAPEPIRVAYAQAAPKQEESLFADWVSPLTGDRLAAEAEALADARAVEAAGEVGGSLAQRLNRNATIVSVAEGAQ